MRTRWRGDGAMVFAVAAAVAVMAAAVAGSPARAQEVAVRGYGDAGTMEASAHLGFGSDYFSGGLGFRYFVVQGLAPGIEGSYLERNDIGQGFLLGSLRLAPVRLGSVIPVLTARGGRVFISDRDGGWAVGGDVGVMFLLSPNVAFEVGYGFLRLLPETFCAQFAECTLYQPVLGVRITF